MAFFLRNLVGKQGKVTVPALGAVVATFSSWTISRPEESDPGNPGVMTLRAVLSYVNPLLLNDPDLTKRVTVVFSKDQEIEFKGKLRLFDENTLIGEEGELCQA